MKQSSPRRARPRLARAAAVSCLLGLPASLGAVFLGVPPAQAYSYAAHAQEPLLDGRAALFKAAAAGDWAGVQTAYAAMKANLAYLDTNEDPGVAQDFEAAIAAKDAGGLRAAFVRAGKDELVRRLEGARQNLKNYEAAKMLVITANRFYEALEPDLDPKAARVIAAQMPKAIDAVGNPGVFGVGTRPPDPEAFDAARGAIIKALGKTVP